MQKFSNSEILIHPHDHKTKEDWQRIYGFLDKNLNYKRIKSFLDLGAGTGNLGSLILERNPNCQIVCQDINPEYLKIISQRDSRIQTLRGDVNKPLPFKNQSFDLVSCVGTLHYSYIKNPEKTLREVIRISKKYILMDCFSKYSPWVIVTKILRPKSSPRRLSSSQSRKLFSRYNLKLIDKIGTRTPFSKLCPFSGKIVLFLLKK